VHNFDYLKFQNKKFPIHTKGEQSSIDSFIILDENIIPLSQPYELCFLLVNRVISIINTLLLHFISSTVGDPIFIFSCKLIIYERTLKMRQSIILFYIFVTSLCRAIKCRIACKLQIHLQLYLYVLLLCSPNNNLSQA